MKTGSLAILLSIITLTTLGEENGTDQIEYAVEKNETVTEIESAGINKSATELKSIFLRIIGIIIAIAAVYATAITIWEHHRPKAEKRGAKNTFGESTSGAFLTSEELESIRSKYPPPPRTHEGDMQKSGFLPPGSRLPFPRNAVFTGRENELQWLERALFSSDSKIVGSNQTKAIVTGIGGMGKSQLAAEFCYRYGQFFRGVHWIQADPRPADGRVHPENHARHVTMIF